MQSKLPVSIPALFFIVFISIADFVVGLYSGFAIQPSPIFPPVFILILWATLSWWFLNDSSHHGWKWLHSWGIFLYAAGWLVIPSYLFKTRGAKALLIILALIILAFGTLVAGVVLGSVVSTVMKH